MTKFVWAGILLAVAGLGVTGAGVLAGGGDDKGSKPTAPPPVATKAEKDRPATPRIADRLAEILAEYEARQEALRLALGKAGTRREQNAVYGKMSPDEAAFCRRMVDLALSAPADPAARDALLWVINKPGMSDEGAYGDEFARASALLVRHHGDDPLAVCSGLTLDNIYSAHRDALLLGFNASAQGRDAKGLARLGLAQYLERMAEAATGLDKVQGRQKRIYQGMIDDDGKLYDKEVEETDEEYAYRLHLRLCNPDAIRAESERLFEEVIADYGDVRYTSTHLRTMQALVKEPNPKWGGVPMTKEEVRKLDAKVNRKLTLGEVAQAKLDAMHNLVVGKPAPEIDGTGVDGKPLKLSDYRGKVVVLVFWGSWCGPCMREVPHERELVERYKDKPFALLGVNSNETREAALKAMKAERMTWPNWHDTEDGQGPIVSRYHIRAYPTVYVLDAKGVIRGKELLGASLDKLVDELLKELGPKDSPN